MTTDALYDVVAVNIKTKRVRLLFVGYALRDAESYEKTAGAVRRGAPEEFFTTLPTGRYHDGDQWKGTSKKGTLL